MRIGLNPLFGKVPSNADNLESVGLFPDCLEEWNDVTVWPGSGVLRRHDGSIDVQTIWVKQHLDQCEDYHSKWSWLPQRRRGRYFNLSLFWWANYYHWHCDVLARLRRVVPKLGPEVRIILPPRLTAWQKRSLELVGLPFNQCVVYCGKRPWKVEDLVYASPVAMTGDHEPESLHWVRDIIREGLGITTAKSGWRRLYLARNRTGSRRVVNEAELLQLLLPRGFDVVDCGSLDYASQVALFSEAAFVVGPHGAAFTNVLWSPAGTQVFEIFEPGSVRRCYWSMCQALGHRHNCGIGEAVAQIHGEANIEVPILEFIQALDALDAN